MATRSRPPLYDSITIENPDSDRSECVSSVTGSKGAAWPSHVAVALVLTLVVAARPSAARATWPLGFESNARVVARGARMIELLPPPEERFFSPSLRAAGTAYVLLDSLAVFPRGTGPPGDAGVEVDCGPELNVSVNLPWLQTTTNAPEVATRRERQVLELQPMQPAQRVTQTLLSLSVKTKSRRSTKLLVEQYPAVGIALRTDLLTARRGAHISSIPLDPRSRFITTAAERDDLQVWLTVLTTARLTSRRAGFALSRCTITAPQNTDLEIGSARFGMTVPVEQLDRVEYHQFDAVKVFGTTALFSVAALVVWRRQHSWRDGPTS